MVFSPSRADTHANRVKEYLAWRKDNPAALAELLAANAVKRGVYWLNRHAPRGWWRNCLNGSSSRIHTGWSGEDVLSIVFEFDKRYADEFGYVQSFKVEHHFGMKWSTLPHRLGLAAALHGLRPFPRRYGNLRLTANRLDDAWRHYLTHPTGEMLSKFCHQTPLDKRFSELDFTPHPIPVLSGIVSRVRALFD